MIINHTTPFLTEDDTMDADHIEAVVLSAGHPHMIDLQIKCHDMIRAHTMLHLLGQEDTEAHNDIVDLIVLLENAIERGRKAAWC